MIFWICFYIIGEKFLFYILLAVLGMLTVLVSCAVIACFGMDITLHSLLLYGSIGMSACLLAGGISLPCAYLFDPEKSQIVFLMSFMASTGIITGLVLLINLIVPDCGKGISETGHYLNEYRMKKAGCRQLCIPLFMHSPIQRKRNIYLFSVDTEKGK